MSRHSGPDTRPDRAPSASVVPAVLPEVVVAIDDAGQGRIVVDNIGRDGIEDSPGSFDRRELGAVLTAIADRARGPIRVEVREADGSRYADILQPHTPETEDDDEPAPVTVEDGPALRGEGFLPGESVLVAVVATSIAADADGTVRLLVSPRAPRRVDELILFGTGSGTIARGTAPVSSARSRQRPRWRR